MAAALRSMPVGFQSECAIYLSIYPRMGEATSKLLHRQCANVVTTSFLLLLILSYICHQLRLKCSG